MKKHYQHLIAITCLTLSASTFAATNVSMNMTADKGVGEPAGTVTVTETQYGLLFTPNLHGLTPGIHGFHLHQTPDCSNNGMAAGGHYDPQNTTHHFGPYNDNGHLGDLPALYVDADGNVTTPVLAPRLHHLSDISNRALMVHDKGDDYSDTPPLGGGGARKVCGVVS